VRLDRLAKQLDDNYPLAPYVQYWQLRSRLADLSPGEIENFLAVYNKQPGCRTACARTGCGNWRRIAIGRVSCANTRSLPPKTRAGLLCLSARALRWASPGY